jgi:hypothetical protein
MATDTDTTVPVAETVQRLWTQVHWAESALRTLARATQVALDEVSRERERLTPQADVVAVLRRLAVEEGQIRAWVSDYRIAVVKATEAGCNTTAGGLAWDRLHVAERAETEAEERLIRRLLGQDD